MTQTVTTYLPLKPGPQFVCHTYRFQNCEPFSANCEIVSRHSLVLGPIDCTSVVWQLDSSTYRMTSEDSVQFCFLLQRPPLPF